MNNQDKPKTPGSHGISRRDLARGVILATVAGISPSALANQPSPAYPKRVDSNGDVVRASYTDPVVETAYGRIRGFVRNGIATFKGVPYGADTSGTNRFLPPQKPAPWAGIRNCIHYRVSCPHHITRADMNIEDAFIFNWDDGIPSEDCLGLNVWTPATDGGKRPVMVWLHGGGYTQGSSFDLACYHGENLSRRGDVVVVTVNHRLGVFGYLNLAGFDERFASSSGNAGMLDIVASLEWVRDNIHRFGGDPNNVTIFGQSGGGSKVITLMTMPSAKSLFHKAIVQSGSILAANTMEISHRVAEKLLKRLELGPDDLDKLQKMPFEQLQAVGDTLNPMPPFINGVVDFIHPALMEGWAPVAGNPVLPQQPFNPHAPEISASVPLIVGCTLNEFIHGIDKPDCFQMNEAELERNVRSLWKNESRAGAVIDAYRRALPGANPYQLWSVIGSCSIRYMTLEHARRKFAQKSAPVYCYRFDWQTPVLDGRPMAFHTSEVPFAFDNTERWDQMCGDGPTARALAARMSLAWVQFARTGDPNHSGIDQWKPFDPDTNGTMLFDNECVYREHLDDECQSYVVDLI